MTHHEPPIITNDTRIWLFKTNPKYYTHVMKPVEGGPTQQFIQNNSHVCVHYKPGDIAIVWLTGDKGKGQMISAYYTIKNIETKTQIQDAMIEDIKENEGHTFRLLDGSNRSEFIKTFEKRKQNSLQLVSAATGQEVPDSLITQKSIIGQQVRLVWRRMNRLVYGEGLHFLANPFHLDGYNHNAYRLYKEIRPEHRDYVVQMILAPPAVPYPGFPPPPPLSNTPPPDSQSSPSPNGTPQKMAINEILTNDHSHSSLSHSHSSLSHSSPLSHSSHSPLSHTHSALTLPSHAPLSHSHTLSQHHSPSLSSHSAHLAHSDPIAHQSVNVSEITDISGTLSHDSITDLSPPHVQITNASMDPLRPTTLTVLTPLTTLTMNMEPNTAKLFSSSSSINKRKRQSSKEKVVQLSEELSALRERLQKLENENYYLKYNLLQIASLGHQNQGLPYIPPLSSPPTPLPSPSPPPPLPDMAMGSGLTGATSALGNHSPIEDTLSDNEEEIEEIDEGDEDEVEKENKRGRVET